MNDPGKQSLIAKYDQIGADYRQQYGDPLAIASRQLELIAHWGSPLPPGSSVLELGCADGLVTEHLAAAGYVVHAVDIAPRMCDAAIARLERAGLDAVVEVADIESFSPGRRYDVVLAMMGSFFTYVDDPRGTLATLGEATRRKLIVDLNPRVTDRGVAAEMLRGAGFDAIDWRPNFVPHRFAVGAGTRFGLRVAERLPGVRELVLTRKFSVVLKGERADREDAW